MVEQNPDRFDLGRVFAHPAGECGEVVLRFVLHAGLPNKPHGADGVRRLVSDDKAAQRTRVRDKQILEERVAQDGHGSGEIAAQPGGKLGGEAS